MPQRRWYQCKHRALAWLTVKGLVELSMNEMPERTSNVSPVLLIRMPAQIRCIVLLDKLDWHRRPLRNNSRKMKFRIQVLLVQLLASAAGRCTPQCWPGAKQALHACFVAWHIS